MIGTFLCAVAQAAQPARKCVADVQVLDRAGDRLGVRLRTNCPLEKAQLQTALAGLKSSAFTDKGIPKELSLFLGRMHDHPWLSLALAKAALGSREWDRVAGKPRHRAINTYVAALLRVTGALDGLLPGWALRDVAVEKVLVMPVAKIAALGSAAKDKSLVPYDAQLWLTLVPLAAAKETGAPAAVNPPARLEE